MKSTSPTRKRAESFKDSDKPSLAPHLEAFAKAVAEGYSHVEAAVICGRKRGSASFLYAQPGVKQRIAELLQIARVASETTIASNTVRESREVTIGRNDVMMLLEDIARDRTAPTGARVRALLGLADIFMMRAKNIEDVALFRGWTQDELQEFARTGIPPASIRNLVDSSKSPRLAIDRKTGHITDEVTGQGAQEEQYPRAKTEPAGSSELGKPCA